MDFAGWEMPIQYSGVVDEYHAVRHHAGLFDVSHMGRIGVTGPGALAFLQRVTTNDVSKLSVRQSQYSMICTQQGGIMDDIFIYHVKPYVSTHPTVKRSSRGCKSTSHRPRAAKSRINRPHSRKSRSRGQPHVIF